MGVASKMWGWKELLNVLLLSFVIALISLGQYVDAGPPRRAPEKIQVQIDDSVVPAQKENQIQNEPNTEPHSEPAPNAEPHPESETIPSEPYAEPYSESETIPYADPHTGFRKHPFHEAEVQFLADSQNSNYVYASSEPYAEPHSEPEPYAEP